MKTIHNNSKMFQSNEFIKEIGYFNSYWALLKRVLDRQKFADIFFNRQMNRSRFIENNFLKNSLQLIFFWL